MLDNPIITGSSTNSMAKPAVHAPVILILAFLANAANTSITKKCVKYIEKLIVPHQDSALPKLTGNSNLLVKYKNTKAPHNNASKIGMKIHIELGDGYVGMS